MLTYIIYFIVFIILTYILTIAVKTITRDFEEKKMIK